MNKDIKKLYDELINPQNGLNEDEFLEKLTKLEDYTTINIYRNLLSNNDKDSVRKSKEYRALKGLNPYSAEQVKKDNIIRNRLERNAINNLVGEKVSISDIINIYSKNINKILKQKIDIKQKLKKLNVVYDEVEGTILPPEGQERIIPGSGKGIEEKEGFDRFSLLLEKVLNAENGFYIGDYRVVIGNNSKNMMRKTSYIVIEIPKINKTIFVNNDYGEATFIYDGIPLDTEIQEKGKLSYRPEFNKITFINPNQWVEQVKQWLFNTKEGNYNKFKGLKFLDNEGKKESIMEIFNSNKELEKEWFSLNTKTRQKFKINGSLGYIKIAKIFGLEVSGNKELYKDKYFIELSKRIFGETHPKVIELQEDLKEYSSNDIIEIFNSNKELEDKWFSLNPVTRQNFKINGSLGYIKIAKIFGLEVSGNNELYKDKYFIELSKRIFGETHPKVIELQRDLKEFIKEIFNSNKELEDKWFSLNTKTRQKFKINGSLGYIKIARIFGL